MRVVRTHPGTGLGTIRMPFVVSTTWLELPRQYLVSRLESYYDQVRTPGVVVIVVGVVSLTSHPARLPLHGKELGIRKSRPPLTSRETSATPTNQLY